MNLLSGLEKFGFSIEEDMDIFAEEKTEEKKQTVVTEEGKVEEIPPEESFLLEKGIRCPVCDKVFKTKMVKNGRVKRLESDKDLRPRHQYIDTLKYDVASCPHCGYTAMVRFFPHLTGGQIKLITENVCKNFKPQPQKEEPPTYDYDTAIERYKLALFNTVVKKGKTSEKAYTCLKIAWLIRGKAETITGNGEEQKQLRAQCQKEEAAFYQQAYDGLMKAVSTEMFPICGMDQSTVDYLLATMSIHYKKYDVASKLLAGILTSQTAGRQIKDKALGLKEEVVAELRKGK